MQLSYNLDSHLLAGVPQHLPDFLSWLWWWRPQVSPSPSSSLQPPGNQTAEWSDDKQSSSSRLCFILLKQWAQDSLFTFRPSRDPASRGMADFLLSVMRPIKWSPSLDGCHVTGCCDMGGGNVWEVETLHSVTRHDPHAPVSQRLTCHTVGSKAWQSQSPAGRRRCRHQWVSWSEEKNVWRLRDAHWTSSFQLHHMEEQLRSWGFQSVISLHSDVAHMTWPDLTWPDSESGYFCKYCNGKSSILFSKVCHLSFRLKN